MARRVWRGGGVLAEGVSVRFASQIRAVRPASSPWGTPHTYGSPALDLKREEERRLRGEATQGEEREKTQENPEVAGRPRKRPH